MVSGPLTDRCYAGQAMQIVCPSCATSYQIAEMAVGASGRSVRCARCQNVWHVEPPPAASPADRASTAAFRAEPREQQPEAAPVAPESSEPADEPTAEADARPPAARDGRGDRWRRSRRRADGAVGDSDSCHPRPACRIGRSRPISSPEIDNAPPDIESAAAARRPRTATRKRKKGARLPLAAAIAALMLVSAALLGFRKDVVRHAPQLASFYSAIGMPVNLRGLAFTDLKIGNEIHDGVPVLVIEGMIVSTTSKTVGRAAAALCASQRQRRRGLFLDRAADAAVARRLRDAAVPQPARLAARRGPRHRGAVLHPPRCGRKPLRRPWRAS